MHLQLIIAGHHKVPDNVHHTVGPRWHKLVSRLPKEQATPISKEAKHNYLTSGEWKRMLV
eukprot:5294064-Amphidinium_carterae.2